MSDEQAVSSAREDAETSRFAAGLKQDARAWSARESDAADRAVDRAADATLALAAKAAKPAPRKRAKAAAVVAAPADAGKSRPFSMSYEGVSNAQYLAGRVARGAR
jgi:hypothetical protein